MLQGLLGSSPGGCWWDGAQFRAGLVLVLLVSVSCLALAAPTAAWPISAPTLWWPQEVLPFNVQPN